jgi:hypothetical protein
MNSKSGEQGYGDRMVGNPLLRLCLRAVRKAKGKLSFSIAQLKCETSANEETIKIGYQVK